MRKPPLHVVGMFGIGDNLHQRAVVIELLQTHEVWLETCHVWVYRDLLDEGDLHLMLRPTSLRMQAQNLKREQALHPGVYENRPPRDARQTRVWYRKAEIDRTGSLLGAMFLAAGLPTPERPDFSVQIRPEWRTARVSRIVAQMRDSGKPLMVYRPLVLSREWDSRLRNPDPVAYEGLFRSVRDDFYVVSVASLSPGVEWIVGSAPSVDLAIHDGSLEMWEMAALFAEADVAFVNGGFAPVLAQAVGTPSVVVYGGFECHATTHSHGARLTPTLPVDTDDPCRCFSQSCGRQCSKRIDVQSATIRIRDFLDVLVLPQKEMNT